MGGRKGITQPEPQLKPEPHTGASPQGLVTFGETPGGFATASVNIEVGEDSRVRPTTCQYKKTFDPLIFFF